MILREFFYLRKSDRRVVVALLLVVAIALGVIFLTDGRQETPKPMAADSLRRDSLAKRASRVHRHRVDTVYLKPRYYYYPRPARRQVEAGSRVSVAQTSALRDTLRVRQPVRHKIGQGEYVVLNTADTTTLMTVPGIGSYYARRIVQYGERLGGYVSVSQIDEIEEVPAEVKTYLRILSPQPRLLNVNKLSLSELRRHPYINYYQAKAITDYRRLHGPLKSLDDLRLSRDFPQDAIDRLQPYVEF